jgi:hypothetical protein
MKVENLNQYSKRHKKTKKKQTLLPFVPKPSPEPSLPRRPVFAAFRRVPSNETCESSKYQAVRVPANNNTFNNYVANIYMAKKCTYRLERLERSIAFFPLKLLYNLESFLGFGSHARRFVRFFSRDSDDAPDALGHPRFFRDDEVLDIARLGDMALKAGKVRAHVKFPSCKEEEKR